MRLKALITGFEKWGEEPGNPTERLVSIFDGKKVNDIEIYGFLLPVAFNRARKEIVSKIEEIEPDIIINTGLAASRLVISIERVAVNIIDARRPDNDGVRPIDEPIDPEGPFAYPSTLPTRRIFERLKSSGIPAKLSYSAGTYLCNFVMYLSLRTVDKLGMQSLAGFIHVPHTPDLAAKKDKPAPSMSIDLMEKALKIALEESAAHYLDKIKSQG